MNEKSYPIYRFWLRFTDPGHNVESEKMSKDYPSVAEARQALQEFIDYNLDAVRCGEQGKYTLRSLNLPIIGEGWKFVREDTWLCQWFNHSTYNTHLTDKELLDSFARYVARHKGKDYKDLDYICLMGAEDRWRWKGPCRCKDCQARGIVMIDH